MVPSIARTVEKDAFLVTHGGKAAEPWSGHVNMARRAGAASAAIGRQFVDPRVPDDFHDGKACTGGKGPPCSIAQDDDQLWHASGIGRARRSVARPIHEIVDDSHVLIFSLSFGMKNSGQRRATVSAVARIVPATTIEPEFK